MDGLAGDRAVELILRPDIEDRSFHDTTKALYGPEEQFPAATRAFEDGFHFTPGPAHGLAVTLDGTDPEAIAASFAWAAVSTGGNGKSSSS